MISTLLTGLGRIGQLYDYNLPSDKFNLSHAQALTSDKRFNLLAGVDINSDHRQRFETKFGKPALCDLSELKGFPNPELVVIATPAETHEKVVLDLLECVSPRAILCEKPLSYDLKQSEKIVKECEYRGVDLFVNFIRRTDPAILKLKSMLNKNKLSTTFSGICWYSRGLYNTGSHFVDLFQFLFGQPIAWSFRKKLSQSFLKYLSFIIGCSNNL